MGILETLFPELEQAQDPRKIYPWQKAQPDQNAAPIVPQPAQPDPRYPREADSGLSMRGAALASPPSPPPANNAPAPVPVGIQPTPQPKPATQPVPIGPQPAQVPGAAVNTPAMAPPPPPAAKPTFGNKATAVALGALSGVPAAQNYIKGVEQAPIQDYDKEAARGRQQVTDIQTADKSAADLAQTQAQTSIALSQEQRNAAAPPKAPADPKTVDTGDGVFQYNDATGRYDIRVGGPKKAAGEDKFRGVPVSDVLDEIKSDTQKYPNGDIYSNRVKAAEAIMRGEANAKREPPQPQRELMAVPQQDGSSKMMEVGSGSTIPAGAQKASDYGKKSAPTADEIRRADISNNLTENLDALDDIATRRPELFGKLSGRWTQLKGWAGTDDADVAKLRTIHEQLGIAQISAHGMRSGAQIESAAESIMNGYKNGANAIHASTQAARRSVQTFKDDVERKEGARGATNSGKDFGSAEGKAEGSKGTMPDGTKVIVQGGRIISQ